jgi:hypothetical protein
MIVLLLSGAYVNYTTVAEARRRRTADTFKTGKNNMKELDRYVRWGNRTSNWVCIIPMDSQDPDEYEEGKDFPACAHFQADWTYDQAMEAGYRQPWMSGYANRIEGTDGQMHGNPVDTEKVQIYSSDIYRSAYFPLIDPNVNTWHNIPLRR